MNDLCNLLTGKIDEKIIYLGYYLKEMDWQKFQKFLNFVSQKHKISKTALWKNSLTESLTYNISPLEYFLFHFYELSQHEKESFAGTGTMYEYQLLMNPQNSRSVLEDKIAFLKAYAPFVRHHYFSLKEAVDEKVTQLVLGNKSGKIVLKNSRGQCGIGVEVRSVQ